MDLMDEASAEIIFICKRIPCCLNQDTVEAQGLGSGFFRFSEELHP